MKIARVIDYETTDTPEDNPNAEVIEMGCIDLNLETLEISNEWQSLCCPRGQVSPQARAVHHITDEELRKAPQARELWDHLFEGCGDEDILVAHNAALEQHFHAGDGRRWIDTYKVARIVYPDAPKHTNQCLRYWLDLTLDPERASPAHRALPDAYVTAHLLKHLLSKKTVEEMVAISKYPALIKTLHFGKHKGTTFEDAPLDYLEWLRDKSDMGEDVKFSAHYWIRKRSKAT